MMCREKLNSVVCAEKQVNLPTMLHAQVDGNMSTVV